MGEPPQSEANQRSINGYNLIDQISEDAFGITYHAEKNSQHYTLKKLKCSNMTPDDITVAKRELMDFQPTVKDDWHVNVVKYEDSFLYLPNSEQTYICIVTEYCEGDSLKDLIDRKDSKLATPDFIIGVMEQICNGLQWLHKRKNIHSDIRPANIFLNSSGTLKIGCFGSAKIVEKNPSLAPDYMAPELRQGQRCNNEDEKTKSDMWSVGFVLSKLYQAGNFQDNGLRELYEDLQSDNPSNRPRAEGVLHTLHMLPNRAPNGSTGSGH